MWHRALLRYASGSLANVSHGFKIANSRSFTSNAVVAYPLHVDTAHWDRIRDTPYLPKSLALLQEALSSHILPGSTGTPATSHRSRDVWSIIRLFSDKVRSSQDVLAMAQQFSQSPSSYPVAMQPSLLTMTAYFAIKHDVDPILDQATHLFLELEPSPGMHDFNRFLRVISGGSRRQDTVTRVQKVLDATAERGITISTLTYRQLLKRRAADADLARVVEAHMQVQGHAPNGTHLHHFIRIHGHLGDRVTSQRYLRAARAHRTRSMAVPALSNTSQVSDQDETEEHTAVVGTPASVPVLPRSKVASTLQGSQGTAPPTKHRQRLNASIPVPGSSRISDDLMISLESALGSNVYHPGSAPFLNAIINFARKTNKEERIPLADYVRAALRISRMRRYAPRRLLFTYTSIISGLLARCRFRAAAQIFLDLERSSGHRLDATSVRMGVQALIRAHQPADAIRVLEGFYQHSMHIGGPRIVAAAMDALGRINRADAAFMLWDDMELLYNASPNHYAFTTMMGIARWSKKYSTSLRGAIAQINLRRFINPFHRQPEDAITDERARTLATLERILRTSQPQTGLWRGMPAHKRAFIIASHVFLSTHPQLLDVQSPVRALRSSGYELGNHPFTEFTHAMQSYTRTQAGARTSQIFELVEPIPQTLAYHAISPSEPSFRQYIHLLAANDLSSEIPLALAWMHALELKPSRRTTAIALVYFRTVATDAPLIESLKGGFGKSPYAKLDRWLREWVGDESMPTDLQIGEEMRTIEAYNNFEFDAEFMRHGKMAAKLKTPSSPLEKELFSE